MIIANQQILFTVADSKRLHSAKSAMNDMQGYQLEHVAYFLGLDSSGDEDALTERISNELARRFVFNNEDPYDLLIHAIYS